MVVIGCGGNAGPGGGGVGGGIGGGGGVSRARVNDTEMNRPGVITTTFITGQGRAAATISAVFRFITFTPNPNTPSGERVESTLSPELVVGLDAYTHNGASLNSPTLPGTSARSFDTFTLNVQKMRLAAPGSVPPYFDLFNPTNVNAPILNESFAMRLKTMNGRHSGVPIFLEDAMLNHDGVNVQFDRTLFQLANYDVTEQRIIAFFSDYVSFDLSNMATGDRPILLSPEGAGAPADTVYFSGDSIALSADVGGDRVFEILTPQSYVSGVWSPPANSGPVNTSYGTYTLLEVDPQVLPVPNAARLVSLIGIWRPYDLMFQDLGDFEMFTIPNSEDRDDQDVVMIQRNGFGQIVNMYFGVAFLNSGSLSFSVFPINQVDSGSVGNELEGVISGLQNSSGSPTSTPSSVRSGTFTFTTAPLPGGFPATGRFVVMRK